MVMLVLINLSCRLLGRCQRNVGFFGRSCRCETLTWGVKQYRNVIWCLSQNANMSCFVKGMNPTERHTLSTRSRSDFLSQISGTAAEKLSSESLIEAWFSEVSPFGTLTVQNFPFKVHIHPLNLADYPDMNKSIVKMYYDAECDSGSREHISGRKLSEIGKVYEMNISVSEDGEKMHITCKQPPGVRLPVVCEMFLPMRYAITMVSDHDISISNMESEHITIHLLNGDCHLKHIKCGAVSVSCDKGNITTEGHLLGNIRLHCGRQGKIQGERFQGTTVLCKTEDGDVNIKMLYTEKSDFSSGSGDIMLGGSHGNISAESKRGNLTVGSLDGSLYVNLEDGSADVFVARSENVIIDTKQGDVTLRLPERASYSLDLNAPQVEKDDTFSRNTDQQGNEILSPVTSHKITATALKGKISLKTQDWLSSLKLNFGSDQ